MPRIALFLLGPFEVTLDGEPLTAFESDKARALLAYLAVESDRPHSREKLAGLFWPDSTEAAARANLSHALNNLRHLLGDRGADPPLLLISHRTIQFNRDADALVDVLRFTDLSGLQDPAGLEQAAALYRGRFLEGFSLPGCQEFEEWLLLEGEHLHRRAMEALARLAAAHEAEGALEAALSFAWRQTELDPWWEGAHLQAMRLLARTGRRDAALAQYQACRRSLAEGLGVEPSAETRALHEFLLKGEPLPEALLASRPAERAARAVGTGPFRGLAAFREADAAFFFGREAFTERLLAAVDRQPLVVVAGSSGSGKSSAVFAGLVPRLRTAGEWLVADLRPGPDPFRALAAALLPFLSPNLGDVDRLVEVGKLAEALVAGKLDLCDALEPVLQVPGRTRRLLLSVDQFEELYTLCAEPEVRRSFVHALLAAAGRSGRRREPSLVLLLTMRADFMGQALAYRPFADALQEASLLLGPMNRDELRAAIEKPADAQGAAFEPGLVQRILDDVGEEPGNLPLLEFTLALLWERHNRGWLTHEAYEGIGGVAGALARHADQVYAGLDETEQAAARRVFAQLVRPGEGTDDTRRRAARAEVGDENWDLVQHLADRRLVVTGRDAAGAELVEVVHESLIQKWGQMRGWIEAGRAFRTWQERLRSALGQWEATGRDQGALLRGTPLVEAEGWLAERAGELSEAEQDYVRMAVALREQRAAEREAQRQRELAAAQRLAEERAAAAGRLRRRAAWLALALIVALAAVGVAAGLWNRSADLAAEKAAAAQVAESASTQSVREAAAARTAQALEAEQRATAEAASREAAAEAGARATQQAVAEAESRARATQQAVAEAQTSLATSRELAAAAVNASRRDPELGVLLALEAVEAADTIEAQNALHATLPGLHLLHTWPDAALCYGFDLTGDVRRIALAIQDVGVTLWQLPTSPQWDVAEMQPLATLTTSSPVRFCRLGRDGVHLYVDWTADDGSLVAEVWDLSSQRRLFTAPQEAGAAPCWGDASPDMQLVFTGPCQGEASSTLTLWEVGSGRRAFSLQTGHTSQQSSTMPQMEAAIAWATFSADGTRLVTAGIDGSARVWDTTTGKAQFFLTGHGGQVLSAEFSPDGQRLATAGDDNTARIWDLAPGPSAGQEMVRIERDSQVMVLAFSPDGTKLATGAMDASIELWNATDGAHLLSLQGSSEEIRLLVFGPDGARLFSGAGDDPVTRLWDLSASRELLTLEAAAGALSVAWSPDASTIAAGTGDGRVLLWDSRSGAPLPSLAGHSGNVIGLAFSPDGSRLATASWDGTARVWDTRLGAELLALPDYGGILWCAAFSSDGRKLAISRGDGKVVVWDAVTGRELLSLEGHTDLAAGVAWSQDDRRLASGSWDDTVRLWDAATGEALAALPHGSDVFGVAFSPDGSRLAAGERKGPLTIWDVAADPPVVARSLAGHTNTPVAVAWSPDGTRLASGSFDGTVRLWDAASGQELLNLAQHTGEVLSVSFGPDGSRLASAGADGTVRVYALRIEELLALARERLSRFLTDDECRRYLHVEECPAEP